MGNRELDKRVAEALGHTVADDDVFDTVDYWAVNSNGHRVPLLHYSSNLEIISRLLKDYEHWTLTKNGREYRCTINRVGYEYTGSAYQAGEAMCHAFIAAKEGSRWGIGQPD